MVVSNMFCSSLPGEMIQFDEHIFFQLGGLISPSSCCNVRVGAFNTSLFPSAPRLLSGVNLQSWSTNASSQYQPKKTGGGNLDFQAPVGISLVDSFFVLTFLEAQNRIMKQLQTWLLHLNFWLEIIWDYDQTGLYIYLFEMCIIWQFSIQKYINFNYQVLSSTW